MSDLAVERALIAGLLAAPAEVMAVVGAGLRPHHLSTPAHRLIFQAMADLGAGATSVDVRNILAREGDLEAAGGPGYLQDLELEGGRQPAGWPVLAAAAKVMAQGGAFEARGAAIGRVVDQKQAAYGDSFGKSGAVLRLLYPNGIAPQQLDDALAITRVVDKLFRIATDRDALGESPWLDVAGYGLLGAARVEVERSESPQPRPFRTSVPGPGRVKP